MECLHKIFVYSAAYIVQQTPTLKSRSSKAKPKEKNLAFKAKEIMSDDKEEEEEDYEDDE